MGKVFRFHPGADLSHWQVSSPLNNIAINAIEDPNGLTAKKEITSIPSPFARIDLVRTAFKNITDSKDLDGKTIFHKMISDSLDIAQIFFKSETFEDKISIIAWDKRKDLDLLLNSSNIAHRTLGETLRLFLNQDSDVYNFNDLQRIYLINYKSGPNPINIIGGTSPCSLFFSTANNLNYVNIQEGQDTFFDEDYCPLYKRDSDFIKFIFGLSKSIPNFSTKFAYFYEYLNLTYTKLSQELKDFINNNSAEWYLNLPSLTIDGIGTLEINGNLLKTKKNSPIDIQIKSDFVIESSKQQTKLKPLVLPNDIFNEALFYTTDKWDFHQKAPFFDSKKINDRKLPYVNDHYPYLTICDFLEPVILRTLLPVNSEFFFDGNHQKPTKNSNKGFLLPIKPTYFDYFNLEDLKKKTIDGNPYFELKSLSNESVEAILRIPIKHNKYITFKRIYNNPVNNNLLLESDEENNFGVIVENVFTVALFPFFKYPNNIKADYRISIYEGDYLPITEQNKYDLKFYNDENKQIDNIPISQKRFKHEIDISNSTFILNTNFNYIQVTNNFGNGIIYPQFKTFKGTDQFSFAIDFGTTNTHIEYSVNGNEPRAFDITKDDIQLAKLHDLDDVLEMDKVNSNQLRAIYNYINQDLISKQIQTDSEFSLPFRSSVLYHSNLDFQKSIHTLADISIPLTYERKSYDKVNKVKTNLKWGANNDEENKKILKAYFEKILLLIKAKMILNNGDIDKIKISWFYPSSMSNYKLNLLENLWNESTSNIFNNNIKPIRICESLAPFYYYMNFKGKFAITKPAVSIDLGGGTTDIVVYENNQATLLTSFRFAGNSIFGDDYNRNNNINGFVQKYFEKYIKTLELNSLNETILALKQINSSNNSSDIINSFFSLSTNKLIKDKNLNISFLNDLKEDEDFKIIFLLFFTSIQYHLANLMKNSQKEIPDYMLFSGTASKLLQIIDPSTIQTISSAIINEVFKKVYSLDYNPKISVELSENPKEITSKGGVSMNSSQIINPNDIKKVFISNNFIGNKFIYNELSENEIQNSLNDYYKFLDFFFELNSNLNFNKNFGINPLIIEGVKEFLFSNAEKALKTGLLLKENEVGANFKNENIEETLFFYPIIGSIGELAFNIYSQSLNKKQDE